MVSKHIDWNENLNNYENIGQQVLFNAIEGNTDLKTFKEVLDRLEIDIEELKTEFEQSLKDDEDFKELQKAIIEQSKNYADRFKDLSKRWENE